MGNGLRLLFINTLYSPHISGGSEIILQCQVEALKKRGYHVAVMATGPDQGIHEDEVNDVKVYRVGLKNLYWHFTTSKPGKFTRMGWHILDRYNSRMKKYADDIIEREKPDVVFSHNLNGWSVSAWDAFAEHNVPIVQVLHDLYLSCAMVTMFKNGTACERQCLNCKLLRTQHKPLSDKVSAVVGVSKFISDKFTSFGYFKNAKKAVIHNARVMADPGVKPLSKKGDVIKFGYIGALSEAKGVKWLIEQFQKLDINATLTIAGIGSEESEKQLRGLVTSDKIKFIGYAKAFEFYQSIDVSIAPSIWPDTFPGVAYEACAHHVPVIASNIGGLPEIIKDKENGLLCNPLDPDSLGKAITTLYEDTDLRNRLAENARRSVADLLSVDRMTDDYESLIQDVVSKKLIYE